MGPRQIERALASPPLHANSADMTWYYAENNTQIGPVSDDELRTLVASGRVRGESLLWKAGLPAWAPLAQAAPEFLSAAGALAPAERPFGELMPETALCSVCNRFTPVHDQITIGGQRVCAGCKPVYLQKLKQGDTIQPTFRYAGFWIRFAAIVVDSLILMPFILAGFFFVMPKAFASADANLLINLAFSALGIAYKIFFIGKFGATPGKMVAGIKVIRPDGSAPGFGLAAGRAFAEIISGIILYVGYIMAAFDDEKRSLHDRICNTRVVYKK